MTVITDSNGRTVTKHLRRLMGEHEIKEVTGIYHTTDLLAKIRKDKKPTSQNTIILMGTNDVRTGNAERANRNIQELAKLLDAEKTIVATSLRWKLDTRAVTSTRKCKWTEAYSTE